MKDVLKYGFDCLGIDVDDDKIYKLQRYSELLRQWNERMNLTSITDTREIAIKHFLDSGSALITQKVAGKVVDVGTGAGFPGLVLKILKPEIELTLLDSLNKRLLFLNNVIDELKIEGAKTVHSRAEDGGQNLILREKYDTVVSRAVANMTLLSELCIPYSKVGGNFIALKGPAADEELNNAKRAISILGGEISEIYQPDLYGEKLKHKIVVIKKVRHTPIRFPRKPALISKCSIESCYNNEKKAAK